MSAPRTTCPRGGAFPWRRRAQASCLQCNRHRRGALWRAVRRAGDRHRGVSTSGLEIVPAAAYRGAMTGPESPQSSPVPVDLEPLAGDLARVEAGLREAVTTSDPFLARRRRPPDRGRRQAAPPDPDPLHRLRGRGAASAAPVERGRHHGGVRRRARAPRVAVPRRRDRRGRDPPRRPERERALEQHRRDPRRRLPPRPRVVARRVARRRRRRAARRHHRRAVPRAGARAPAPLRRRPLRRRLREHDRRQDRRAVRDVVPHRRHGRGRRRRRRSTR